ncbi:DUF1983 domain-containing protein [Pseudomonas sp. BYT-1]|uniref:phage tail protein n=1 Tax=Pseudomonas sp. BYT-1 TaxID=2816906 RepID=UPI002025DD99|nr:phage tail protein [Pseudomonas sp. BYT-1]URK96005.1 DUF1983 domain-containing protein [Pseudomonas sp. BYT-1]
MSKAVKKVALVAAGAALGFVTGGVGFAIIGGAVGLFVGSQQDAALKGGRGGTGEPSAQTVRSSKAPARFILGRVSTGGVLVWAQEQTGNQGNGEWVHLVYVLSEGAVDGLEKIYLGEEEIGTYGEYASYELIVNPTQVNAFLKANCRDWKDSQIGRGLSFVRMSLKHNAEKFPSGIPNVRFVVRGRRDLYDPRTGMTGYSENTALHLLWFLRARCKVPDDEIVFESFASAANVCDEAVGNADGTTGVRYRTGCVIGADEQRTSVLQKLEESCAGQLIRVGGKWMLQAGAYYGPYDFEITEDMVIGTVSGSTEVGNDAAINIVTGTFIDPSQSWAETDFPEVRVQQWVDQDGGEASESMSLGYVTDAYQAQRLANIKLRRARAGGSLQIPMNFAGYNCRPGRVVRVNLPSLNIVGECIVTDWNMASDDGCTVTVSQYEAAIFDDAVGKPYNPIGFINLPAGGLGSPTGLTWTQDETAEITQGVLSWVPPFGVVTGYAVTVRRGGVAVQARQVPETTMQLPFSGLPSGNYTMSVAALGPLARSGEASITVNIDGPPVPEACVVQSTIESISLFPSNVQHGLNGGTYEYFYTMDPQAAADQAEYLGQGLSLTHTGLAFFTNYYYFIRSRNAYGVSGFLKIAASTSNDVTAMLAALAGKITETQLGQDLLEEIQKIPGLQDQIDALGGLTAYDKDSAYTKDQMVVADGKIYQAKQAVPANSSGANAPPNTTYWIDVGQSLVTANGLAQQVATNTVDISNVDGKVTAQAASFEALRASTRDDDGSGAMADALKGWESTSALATEKRVRSTENMAMAERLTTFDARVATNEANITSLERVVATNESATAQKIDQLNVSVGENSAAIQQTSTAFADTSGKLSTMWSVKMQLNAQGQYVAAGIGLGIENGPAGLQSQFLVSADRFAVVNGINGTLSAPFVVQGGQVFINQAFINTAFIQQIILGMTLRSQAVDSQGRPLIELNMVTGAVTIRGQSVDGSILLNNNGLYVYDNNGVERTAVGRLS